MDCGKLPYSVPAAVATAVVDKQNFERLVDIRQDGLDPPDEVWEYALAVVHGHNDGHAAPPVSAITHRKSTPPHPYLMVRVRTSRSGGSRQRSPDA